MQIITVSPIVRGTLKEHLTYFSKEPLEVGTVVMVPIRTRKVPAIVLETKNVSDVKTSLKSSDFAIRKIEDTAPLHFWTSEFLKAIERTANFSAQKFGETLLALTPKTILDAHLANELPEAEVVRPKKSFEILATQNDTKTRVESYQRLVRESFVRHESVFVCVPTEDDVDRLVSELGRGIESYTFAFHSSFTKKRILENWKRATKEEHAVLIIGTAQYLGIPRHFRTIILDEEHSRGWKTITRPFLDLRFFVEQYAMECGSTFIIGAPILRAETHARINTKEIGEFGRIAARTLSGAECSIVDPRTEEKSFREQWGKRILVVLSEKTRALLETAEAKHEHILLVAARKGVAPVTSCEDCGTLVRCPECETPLVVHKSKAGDQETQLFVCHACGFMRRPENNVNETCTNCKGWKLRGVGISVDRIEKEVIEQFPNLPVFILDGDHAKTRTQAKSIIEKFKKSPSGVLVATPMAIPLIDSIDHAAIISIDSLFTIPDIRMSERIFALILALREKVTHSFIIQTRADDTTILEQSLKGDLATFTENELTLRKAFFYSPYGTIIKITLRDKRESVTSDMEHLKTFLNDYSPLVPSTMSREPKGIFRMHMIIKLPENSWPNNTLLTKLRTLPAQFTTEVNPDHLL